MTFYLIDITGGTEASALGPWKTFEERDENARLVRARQDQDDSLFWADVSEQKELVVGPYVAAFFEEG